jgi:hypothetical protein
VDAPRRPRTGKKPKSNTVEENELQQSDVQDGIIEHEPGYGDLGYLHQQLQQQFSQQRQSLQQFPTIHQQLILQQSQQIQSQQIQQMQPQHLQSQQMQPQQIQSQQMSPQQLHSQQMQQKQPQQIQQQQQPNTLSSIPLPPYQVPVQQPFTPPQQDQGSFVPPSPTTFFAQLLNEIGTGTIPDMSQPSNITSIDTMQTTIQPDVPPKVSFLPRDPDPIPDLSTPASDLVSANKKIEALATQINKMTVDMEQIMSTVNAKPVSSKLPAFPDNPLPSYLDTSHPLNAETAPMAVWQVQDRLLVDCNFPFAQLLGYDTVPQLLLNSGIITLIDIMAPAIRDKALKTCTDAILKNVRYFERPAIFVKKDGSEIKVFMKVAQHGPQFITCINVLDPQAHFILASKHFSAPLPSSPSPEYDFIPSSSSPSPTPFPFSPSSSPSASSSSSPATPSPPTLTTP